MPYFELKKGETKFPPAHFADIEGLVAVGGDMNADILLEAYNSGLYYWHHPMKHIKWWSPDPRMVLHLPFEFPEKDQNSDRNSLQAKPTENVDILLRHLQSVFNLKEDMDSRWLSERMFRVFTELHQRGLLRCIEIRENGQLIGGLFGTAIGRLFFGEYMWAPDTEALELGLKTLIHILSEEGLELMDMQKPTFQSGIIPCDEISRLSYVDRCKMNASENDY